MADAYLVLLMYLAEKTRMYFSLESSTTRIAADLRVSQQTISRKLREMESLGLIERQVKYNGHVIRLTEKSAGILKRHHSKLSSILNDRLVKIRGRVVDGLGEGRYYLSLPKYREALRKRLGFSVYPGTLNLKVCKDDILPFVSSLSPIAVNGFMTKDRTFGDITCYKIKFLSTTAAIIIPERTRYDDVLEIIAPFNLRKQFGLKTGSSAAVSLPG